METSRCLICYEATLNWTSLNQNDQEDVESLNAQLRVVFILRNLLGIPKSKCVKYLQTNGNPRDWVHICSNCSLFVNEAMFLNSQIKDLHQKMNSLKNTVCSKISQSYGHSGNKIPKALKITEEARKLVFSRGSDAKQFSSDISKSSEGLNFLQSVPRTIPSTSGNAELKLKNSYSLSDTFITVSPIHVKEEIEEKLFIPEGGGIDIFEDCCITPEEPEEYMQTDCHNLSRRSTRLMAKDVPTKIRNVSVSYSDKGDYDLDPEESNNDSGSNGWNDHDPDTDWDEEIEKPLKSSKSARKGKDKSGKRVSAENQRSLLKGPPFECEICNKEFNLRNSLTKHKNYIHNMYTKKHFFKCMICEEQFNSKDEKFSHESTVHQIQRPEPLKAFPCDICQATFITPRAVRRHLTTSHTVPNNPTQHEAISPSSATKSKTKKWRKRDYVTLVKEVDLTPWKCSECNTWFKQDSERDDHEQTSHQKESLELPFACEICNKSYQLKSDLCLHLELLHDGINLEPLSEIFQCEECPSKFSKQLSLDVHMAKIHNQHSRKTKSKVSCICEVCGLGCYAFHYLRIHMQRHSGERLWVCDLCAKTFTSTHYLNMHKTKEHSEESAENHPFGCKECNKIFANRDSIHYHRLNVHKKEYRYICEICGTGRQHPRMLERHMQMCHSTERPLKCHYAGCTDSFRFGEKNKLNVHIRSKHTGERPYKCTHCGKGFTNPNDCKRHEQAVHSTLTPFKCHICQKGFPIRDYYRIHMRSCQKKVGNKNVTKKNKLDVSMSENSDTESSSHAVSDQYELSSASIKNMQSTSEAKPVPVEGQNLSQYVNENIFTSL